MDNYPKRKQNRLKEYDYSAPGHYFVTICIQDRIEKFGTIIDDKMILNESGEIVKNTWLKIPAHFNNIVLNQYIIMPNHIHGIIINDSVGNGRDRSLPIKSLSSLTGAFKTTSSKLIHENNLLEFKWQKSFHGHIIRIDESLNKIREYIINNPAHWGVDEHNIKNPKVTVQACLNPTQENRLRR